LFQVSFSSFPSFLLLNCYSSLFLNFFVSPLSASDFLPCSPLSYFYSLFLNFVTLFVQHSLSAMASSSAAPSNSASVGTFKPTGANKDLAWQFNHRKDKNKKNKVTCNFCLLTSSGGITRARRHQLGIKGDVAACRKTPPDVKVLLQADLNEKKRTRKGKRPAEPSLPDNLTGDYTEQVQPKLVLAKRTVQQVLVQWRGKTTEEATWEDMITIKSQFPQFCLEDKAFGLEGGIDRGATSHSIHNQHKEPKKLLVYSRRAKKGYVSNP
jgi:hypothetical protein